MRVARAKKPTRFVLEPNSHFCANWQRNAPAALCITRDQEHATVKTYRATFEPMIADKQMGFGEPTLLGGDVQEHAQRVFVSGLREGLFVESEELSRARVQS